MGNISRRETKHEGVEFPSKLDLVTAAQAEYDFLRLVDKHPALYSISVLKNAMYRYETYWLPLAAEYDLFLPAPLDIEWVWHCHILNPRVYAKDCEKIVKKVVDHRPMFLVEQDRQKSMDFWHKRYPEVPFDVDISQSSPVILFDDTYHQQSSYDVVKAAQRQRVFNYNSSFPHYRDTTFLNSAVSRYKTMLEIMRDNPQHFVVPCYDNDLIWHTHQLFVLHYQLDTISIMGRVLGHDDSTSDRTPGSPLENSTNSTKQLWQKLGKDFGVPGAMYRGEPPLPEVAKDTDEFISYSNKTCNITIHSIKLHNISQEENYQLQIFKVATLNSSANDVDLSESIELDFIKGKVVSVDTGIYHGIKITCSSETKTYRTTLAIRNLCDSSTNTNISYDFCLKDASGLSKNGTLCFDYALASTDNYTFSIHDVSRVVTDSNHLKDVVSCISVVSSNTVYQSSVPCQYIENIFQTNMGESTFRWRTVHCQQPSLSVVEILDSNNQAISTSHTLSSFQLPTKCQLSDEKKSFAHTKSIERAMLIRSKEGDYAILKAAWIGYRKESRDKKKLLGKMRLSLFVLNGKESIWCTVNTTSLTQFDWLIDDCRAYVNIESGIINLMGCTKNIAQHLCIACSIAVLFVLCHPRPPPPASNNVIQPYFDAVGVPKPHVDSMILLLAAGLYSSMLPRWYRESCKGEYLYQFPPACIRSCQAVFWGDFDYVYHPTDKYVERK